jgi:hypothetical protein
MQALIEEAAKKASLAWLTVPGAGAAYPVWCMWAEGAVCLVTGPGEQPAPGLAEASTAAVTMRGDHGGRVVTWPAAVSRLDPTGEQWAALAPQLAGKRLNATGGAEETVKRWASECAVYQLAPAGDPQESGETLPDSSLAEPVRQTPATRAVRKPVRFHRVRNR